MSTIGAAAIRLREAVLRIAADDYTATINQVIFTPTPDVLWHRPEASETYTPLELSTKWSVSLGFLQDFTSTSALSIYLMEHAGQYKVITLETPGRIIAATALILPAQLGGVANQIPAAVVTLPMVGKPELDPNDDYLKWGADGMAA